MIVYGMFPDISEIKLDKTYPAKACVYTPFVFFHNSILKVVTDYGCMWYV